MRRPVTMLLVAAVAATLPMTESRAQSPAPGEQVRLTTQRDGVRSTHTGWLVSLTPDTVVLRASRRDTMRLSRSGVVRLERRRNDINLGGTMGLGCLVGGATLGGIGLVSRDPDSPGLENTLAVVGALAGCVIGGAAGLVGGHVSRGPWEQVHLATPAPPAGPSAAAGVSGDAFPLGCYRADRILGHAARTEPGLAGHGFDTFRLLPDGKVSRPGLLTRSERAMWARAGAWQLGSDGLDVRLSTGLVGWALHLEMQQPATRDTMLAGMARYLTDVAVRDTTGWHAYPLRFPVRVAREACPPPT